MIIILLHLSVRPVKVYTFDLAVKISACGARAVNLEGHWRTDSTGVLASSICQRTCSDTLERKPTQCCDQRNDSEETAYLFHDTPLCLLEKQAMFVSSIPCSRKGCGRNRLGPFDYRRSISEKLRQMNTI